MIATQPDRSSFFGQSRDSGTLNMASIESLHDVCTRAPFSVNYDVYRTGPIITRDNGVYSLKWRLTDRYLRWGTLAGPRPGQADADQWLSAGTAHLGFPALLSVPHLLSREIKMNRRHSENCFFFFVLISDQRPDGEVHHTVWGMSSIFNRGERTELQFCVRIFRLFPKNLAATALLLLLVLYVTKLQLSSFVMPGSSGVFPGLTVASCQTQFVRCFSLPISCRIFRLCFEVRFAGIVGKSCWKEQLKRAFLEQRLKEVLNFVRVYRPSLHLAQWTGSHWLFLFADQLSWHRDGGTRVGQFRKTGGLPFLCAWQVIAENRNMLV